MRSIGWLKVLRRHSARTGCSSGFRWRARDINRRQGGENQFDAARQRQCHQIIGSGIVRGLPAGQDETDRASLIVRAGVDLVRKSAA